MVTVTCDPEEMAKMNMQINEFIEQKNKELQWRITQSSVYVPETNSMAETIVVSSQTLTGTS
jgi:hypothetical protein